MKLPVKKADLFVRISVYFSTLIRVFLCLLLVIAMAGLAVGVYKTGYDLWQSFNKPVEELLQQLLIDVVFVFALMEISLVILGYLKDGRVHVRYIVDTILIIMLNEVVAAWFTKPKLEYFASLALIIAVLGALRVTVTRWAPQEIETSGAKQS